MKSTIICIVLLCLFVFFHLHMLFTFSALISSIYWCGIVWHQQISMVRHVTPAEIIGAANAAPAAPVPTPMFLHNLYHMFKALVGKCFINLEIERTYNIKNFIKFVYLKLISLPTNLMSSVDKLCKQSTPRSGRTKCRV